jgi:glycosyltransferase involved in cell wall biosynthesis
MTKRLKLALVSAFPPGRQSLNEYGYHLALHLAQRDDVEQVIVLADKLPQPMPELDLGPKITVRRVWSFNALTTLPAILRQLRRLRPDGAVFNLHTASFGDRELTAALGLITPAAARCAGVPSGVIAHNIIAGVDLESTLLQGKRLRQAIVRTGGKVVTSALMRANYVSVTLKSYETHLTQAYPRADITHVPHGTFDVSDAPATPLAQRPARIVTMGKFGTYKRLETLIAAVRSLRRDPGHGGLELVVGGTDHPNAPGYLASVEKACRDDANIRFHGYVAEDDIPAFFGEARLSVFDYETTTGSSGVLNQTASYGAVPVFPKIGDFIDVSRDEGIEGFNYCAGDAQSMADAIRAALSDLPAAEMLAHANRRATRGFPLSKVIDFHVAKLRGAQRDTPATTAPWSMGASR